jgi:hypothetical protein
MNSKWIHTAVGAHNPDLTPVAKEESVMKITPNMINNIIFFIFSGIKK